MHLDLQNTGLNEAALLKTARFLRRAWSLQCVHLSGNPGISPELASKLREMLGSAPVEPQRTIQTYDKSMALPARGKRRRQRELSPEPDDEWAAIRAGLRRQSI